MERSADNARSQASSRDIAQNAELQDDIAQLQAELATQQRQTGSANRRAEAAEERARTLRKALADAAAAHNAEIEKLQRDHEAELLDVRAAHRRKLADAHAGHAAKLERLTKLPAAPLLARGAIDPTATPAELLPGLLAATADADPLVHVDEVGALVAAMVNHLRDGADPHATPLTDRETQLMRAAAFGLESDEIAERMGVNRPALNRELATVFRRLGVGDRAAALAILLAVGWLNAAELGPHVFDDSDEPMDGPALRTRLTGLARCSNRDRAVIMLMALGDDSPVIMDKLGMPSTSAVHTITKRVLRALDAKNRFHAVTILHYLAAVIASEPAHRTPTTTTTPTRPATTQPASPSHNQRPQGPPATVAASGDFIRALRLADHADPAMVTIYNTLTSDQQFTLKALALDYVPGSIGNALHVPAFHIDRLISQICRRFDESTHVGLADLARSLFIERETKK